MQRLNVAYPAQRVFNVYHQLADGTLPPDLWNDSAELAAIVFLAFHYPAQDAFLKLCAAVREYNRINRKLRLPQLFFDASRAKRKVFAVALYIASARRPMHVGDVYLELLRDSDFRRVEDFCLSALQSRLGPEPERRIERQARRA